MDAKPTRIQECPLQIEARVKRIGFPAYSKDFTIVESEVTRVHAHEYILTGNAHIDPHKWSPLIYNFRHYCGLGEPLGKTFRA
ncbi:hypothetical protein GCM10011391_19290 [Pullulanibacillus camelliae]|uniref:Uncharacterized protein n=1 Tax=Pullulanibacillus camelliae TaxID=1707096 RepID=A0A8J2VYI2_9BACL|nr:hypothetical protein GCM10011391_19290 [Pullulanibacillus camelliae]